MLAKGSVVIDDLASSDPELVRAFIHISRWQRSENDCGLPQNLAYVCHLAGDDAWGRPVSHGIGHERRDPWLPRIPQSHWPRTTHPGEGHHRTPALLSLGAG